MANILDELQHYVADKLNADPQLSACPFIVENSKTVDYEIKQALGKQGVCGLVLTPKATYAGAYMDVGIAWQIDELEIDVVENVTVNRGKKSGYITGQDAAMRLFEVLCPLSGEHEGQFNPVSYEEGEDNSLLVNKSVLKCLVHKILIPAKTIVQFADGTSRTYDIKGPLELDWLGVGVYPGEVVDVQIGEEVTGLGERSFTGFGSLSSIVVPKNVTSISGEAFSWCGLRNVVIEDGTTELGYGVFAYNNSLSSVELPSTLQKIGADVFEECYGLSIISVPKSVVDISRVAFRYSRLSAVTMEGRTKAETKAIANYPWNLSNGSVIHCTDGDIIIGSETIVKYTAASGLPDWEGDIVGELGENSVPNKSSIEEVRIGTSVTSIGEDAFNGCDALSNVTIGENVTNIKFSAFYGCNSLTSVLIPNSVSSIGYYAFQSCSSLTNVTFGDSVSSIGRSAFEGCTSLSSVTLPSSVTSIGGNAFLMDSALVSLTLEGKTLAQVQAMPDYPWGISDTSIIHGGIQPRKTSFTLTDGTVEEYDINGELDTQWLVQNGFVRSGTLGNWLKPVKSFEAGENLSSIGASTFYRCSTLTDAVLNDNVQVIDNSAFNYCTALSSVTMPSGLVDIMEYAFNRCSSLTSITIPSNVVHIKADAFIHCTSMADVYCYPNPADLTWDEADKDDFKTDGSTRCHVKSKWLASYQTKFRNSVNVTFVGDLT